MSNRLAHDPVSCPRCDHVTVDRWRRHWKREEKASAWHVIADGPDLMARVPTQAHFVTVLAYCFHDEDSSQYRGPLYFEGDADNPAKVFTDARRCIEFLAIEYGLTPEMLRAWLSGGRSVHITIPPIIFGAEAGHPHLPHIYADDLLPEN